MERIESIGPYVYQYRNPEPLRRNRHCTVAIVGGGPVGLACALGLARQGISSVVIEADDTVCIGSRAACISRRSLEILGRLGGLDEMLARGLPWSGGRTFWGEREVFRFTMPAREDQRLPPMINLQQYYIEDALLSAVEDINDERPGSIEILWATRVGSLAPNDVQVSLGVENTHGRSTITADWVLGCDGGQSFIRDALGLSLEGTAYTGRYAIVDIILPSKHPAERRAWFDPPWYRGGTILMHRQPDDVWRVDWQLLPGDDGDEVLKPENVRRFVQRHLDAIGEGRLAWEPVWSSIYRAGAMSLDRYRYGRVLFAGNSAHAMPIFGVRGLNSGFDDADNLVWKLAAVIRGQADSALLDSYSGERLLAFHTNASYARRSTEFMSPPSRGFDLLREAALSLSENDDGIAELANPRQTAPIAYRGSALCRADLESDDWCSGPAPGEVLQEVPVSGPVAHITEVVTAAFTLLYFGVPELEGLPKGVRLVPVLPAADERWPTAIIDAHGDLGRAYDAVSGAGYLVRPDGHVAARWKLCSADAVTAAHQQALGYGVDTKARLPVPDAASPRDRLYGKLASAISSTGATRESLFLARLALLLFERLDDEAVAMAAVDSALRDLPEPSLSRLVASAPTSSTAKAEF